MMKPVRIFLSMAVASGVSACATAPPSGPLFVASPGTGKDQAAFQQDAGICQQHAERQSGYGAPAAPVQAPGAAGNSVRTPDNGITTDDASFLQCMAARGDTVAAVNYAPAYLGYTYGYAYPFAAFDPYPIYAGGFIGGFGFGGRDYRGYGHHGWGHGGWSHAGWGHGGWGRGGGGHAGGGHGGGGGGHH